MTRLRGYCPTCNGPLWRTEEEVGIGGTWSGDVCRLCWLAIPCADDHLLPHDPDAFNAATDLRHETRGEWRGRVDEANSTENTAATSRLMPLPGRDWIVRLQIGDAAARLDLWLQHASDVGPYYGGSSLWSLSHHQTALDGAPSVAP